MEMFLMAICLSMLGFAVTAVAFGAATRSAETAPEEQPVQQPVVEIAPARFFADDATIPAMSMQARVPIEALLLQIDNHVRLEQAAAESFLAYPTAALLHGRTISTLVQ
ncbi:MAG TPA: hypothetical protein VGK29_05925 [Paludibaculum sp.]|jgi:hypothetical protein